MYDLEDAIVQMEDAAANQTKAEAIAQSFGKGAAEVIDLFSKSAIAIVTDKSQNKKMTKS